MKPFWKFLSDWLRESGWTQTQLADAVGVHQTVVSKWVHSDIRRRARPGRQAMARLVDILGTPLDQLLLMLLEDQSQADQARTQVRNPTRQPDESRVPLAIRQYNLDDAYLRWMAVMAPTMGREQADASFWEDLKTRADTRAADAEAAVKAAQAILNDAAKRGRTTQDNGQDSQPKPPLSTGNDSDNPGITRPLQRLVERRQHALVEA